MVNRKHNDNVTDNGVLTNSSNVNVIDKYERARRVERVADQLVEKFGSDKYRAFYCKVAMKLSEGRIWTHYETATRVNPGAPGKMFTFLVKKDGV